MSVPVSVFTDMKKEKEAPRKVSQDLCSSIALWKGKFNLLTKQLSPDARKVELEPIPLKLPGKQEKPVVFLQKISALSM